MGRPTPAEESGTSQEARTETELEVEGEQSSPDRALETEPKDDGSVPDKQISRWKNEGGSWLPTD
jgi:hypothetical protein